MSIVYLLIPAALLLGAAFLWAFLRASLAGQFDDLETPAHRILIDDVCIGEKEKTHVH